MGRTRLETDLGIVLERSSRRVEWEAKEVVSEKTAGGVGIMYTVAGDHL